MKINIAKYTKNKPKIILEVEKFESNIVKKKTIWKPALRD